MGQKNYRFGHEVKESRLSGHVRGRNAGYIGNRTLRMGLAGKKERLQQIKFIDVVRAYMWAVGLTEEYVGNRREWKQMTCCGDT